jgi:hypothetical protein
VISSPKRLRRMTAISLISCTHLDDFESLTMGQESFAGDLNAIEAEQAPINPLSPRALTGKGSTQPPDPVALHVTQPENQTT